MILFSSSSSQRERSPLLSLSFLFCLLHLFASANGALKNITADDEEGDPAGSSKITYLPSNDSWIQGKTLPDYGGLDISKVWATTWHNASTTGDVFPSISVTFEGEYFCFKSSVLLSGFLENDQAHARSDFFTVRYGGVRVLCRPALRILDEPYDVSGWCQVRDIPEQSLQSKRSHL